MTLFWIGFFAFVAALLALDLGVFHKGAQEQSFASAVRWTLVWLAIGLAFGGVVYGIYGQGWMGARMTLPLGGAASGTDAAIVYWSAYLLEQALSIDNIFVISWVFRNFAIPRKHQHRILFWGVLSAVVFRVGMLGGGAFLVKHFDWVFYIFGAYLAYAGLKLFRPEGAEPDSPLENSVTVKLLRRFVPIVADTGTGRFVVMHHGRRALTTLAVCLIVVELTDVVFALDSVPAVISVSQETFIIITSNIMAILGLRSLYFVLDGAMHKFQYLKYALAVLLVLIGAKMILHHHVHISHVVSLAAIAGILTIGVVVSLVASGRDQAKASVPS